MDRFPHWCGRRLRVKPQLAQTAPYGKQMGTGVAMWPSMRSPPPINNSGFVLINGHSLRGFTKRVCDGFLKGQNVCRRTFVSETEID